MEHRKRSTQHADPLRRHEQLCLRTKLRRQRLRDHLQWRWFLRTEPGGRRDQHGAEVLRNEVLRGPYQLWGFGVTCQVSCSGNQSCAAGIWCTATWLDMSCTGAGSCAGGIVCSEGACI